MAQSRLKLFLFFQTLKTSFKTFSFLLDAKTFVLKYSFNGNKSLYSKRHTFQNTDCRCFDIECDNFKKAEEGRNETTKEKKNGIEKIIERLWAKTTCAALKRKENETKEKN